MSEEHQHPLHTVLQRFSDASEMVWIGTAYDDFAYATLMLLDREDVERVFQAFLKQWRFADCRDEDEKIRWMGSMLTFHRVLDHKGGDFAEVMDRPLPTPPEDLTPRIIWERPE